MINLTTQEFTVYQRAPGSHVRTLRDLVRQKLEWLFPGRRVHVWDRKGTVEFEVYGICEPDLKNIDAQLHQLEYRGWRMETLHWDDASGNQSPNNQGDLFVKFIRGRYDA